MVFANVEAPYSLRERTLGSMVEPTNISAASGSRAAWQVSGDYSHSDHEESTWKSKENQVQKRSTIRMVGGLPGWTTKAFEGDTVFAA